MGNETWTNNNIIELEYGPKICRTNEKNIVISGYGLPHITPDEFLINLRPPDGQKNTSLTLLINMARIFPLHI